MDTDRMIGDDIARRVLTAALGHGGDLAEIYVEDRCTTNLSLEDARVEEAVRGTDRGAGVRVFYGSLSTYAHTDDFSDRSLQAVARNAALAARGANRVQVLDFSQAQSGLEFPIEKPFEAMAAQPKSQLLRDLDQEARRFDPRVVQVQARYSEDRRRIRIWNPEGR